MTFRDDKDALLARADALDRENEALRERNAALEAEAAASAAARAELERMAAQRPEPRPAPVRPSSSRREKSQHERTFARWVFPIFVWSVTFGTMGAFVLAVILIDRLALSSLILLLPVLWIPGSGLVYRAYRDRAIRRELAWIDALPTWVDREGYRRFITTDFSGRLTARIRLASKPDERDRRLVAGAIDGARWDADALVVHSPRFDTHVGVGRGSFVTNHKVHRWFRRLVDRTLPAVAALHPIERLGIG